MTDYSRYRSLDDIHDEYARDELTDEEMEDEVERFLLYAPEPPEEIERRLHEKLDSLTMER